jgi:hypothetical protein
MPDLSGISIAEYSIDYQEFLPMEHFFGSAEGFDWVCFSPPVPKALD